MIDGISTISTTKQIIIDGISTISTTKQIMIDGISTISTLKHKKANNRNINIFNICFQILMNVGITTMYMSVTKLLSWIFSDSKVDMLF
jgi:hypothetical protein